MNYILYIIIYTLYTYIFWREGEKRSEAVTSESVHFLPEQEDLLPRRAEGVP